MLTFHHSFSTRIFLDPIGPSRSSRRVILSAAKDPSRGALPATTTWILRSAQDDARRKLANEGTHAR